MHGKYQSEINEMGVFQCSNEEIYLEKLVFIACDFLTIIKIGEEGHKTFMNACKILLPRVKRENSYINQEIGRAHV